MPRFTFRLGVLCVLGVGSMNCASVQRPRIAGAYRFVCDPPDARVIVDETDEGPCVVWTDRWLGLTPGAHRLQVIREGYFPYEADVHPSGHREPVAVHLRPVPE